MAERAIDRGRLLAAFDDFLEGVRSSPEIARAIARCELPAAEADHLLVTYVAEARAGLDMVAPLLKDSLRVLEVGSGIGVLTRFLHDQGVDIVGIEPGASGFGFMREIGAAVLSTAAGDPVRYLPLGAEALDPERHGTFDLIYSTNVLEHIADLDAAFRGMASVLDRKGEMVHHCPNYFVPYEPHFGVPLVPLFPRATRLIYPKVLTRYPGMWCELNFITASRARRLARRTGLRVRFERGVLARMLRRFDDDAVFRERQGGPAALVGKAAGALGLVGLVEKLPGDWLSPMVMRLTHAAGPTRLRIPSP